MKKLLISISLTLVIFVGSLGFAIPVSAHEEDAEDSYPVVLSDRALVGDTEEERVLFQSYSIEGEDETTLIYPASTTKVMTALLVVEAIERGEVSLDEVLTVGTEVESIDYKVASNARLKVGEEISVRDLLGVLLVNSACEAANVLAVRLVGEENYEHFEREFVYLMNTRASELGMVNTNYQNASGLYADGHVTTVMDLYRLFREACSHELLMDFMKAQKWEVAATNMSGARSYTNHARIVDKENGAYCAYAVGGKSGYIYEGSALVMLGELPDENGDGGTHQVIVVLSSSALKNSAQVFAKLYYDTKLLLEWTAEHFSTQQLVIKGQELGTVSIKNSRTETLSYVTEDDFWYYLPNSYKSEAVSISTFVTPIWDAPVSAGDAVGTIIVRYNGTIVYKGNLIVTESAEQLIPTPLLEMGPGILVALGVVLVGTVVVVLIVSNKKKIKKEKIKKEHEHEDQED